MMYIDVLYDYYDYYYYCSTFPTKFRGDEPLKKCQASTERSVALKELARSLRGDLELLSCLGRKAVELWYRSKKCMVNQESEFGTFIQD